MRTEEQEILDERLNKAIQLTGSDDMRAFFSSNQNPHLPMKGHAVFVMKMEDAIKIFDSQEHLGYLKENCLNAIRSSGSLADVDLANRVKEKLAHIIPSLSSRGETEFSFRGSHVSVGRVATGHPKNMVRVARGIVPEHKPGQSCYVINICTDVASASKHFPTALFALAWALSQIGPVEIWVQQGWIDSWSLKRKRDNPNSVINIFRCPFYGNMDDIAFWTSSPYKDRVFASSVCRALGSKHSYVSRRPEFACDLWAGSDITSWLNKYFTLNIEGFKDMDLEDKLAYFIAAIASKKFFGGENFGNDTLKQVMEHAKLS